MNKKTSMEPERSKSLHNFSLPCLKWGTQRLLRCVNNHNQQSSKLNSPQNNNNPIPQTDETVNAVRERIIGDLKVAAKKLKVSIFEENNGDDDGSNIRPWNLRTRRAACKAPIGDEGRRFFDVGSSSPSSLVKNKKMVMLDDKVKFSVSLSKEEVEQDFWALVGTRPPRRPKKRPRIVQRQLNVSYLSNICYFIYEITVFCPIDRFSGI